MSNESEEKPDEKPKIVVGEKIINKALARGEALWKMICDADLPMTLGSALKKSVPFDKLDDGDKLRIIKIATTFVKVSNEIEETFEKVETRQTEPEDVGAEEIPAPSST